jgi:esterase/lipase superfamily enzyme
MHREYHRWHSPRLGRDMGIAVYGHYGQPILGFPTSGGDEWELEGQGMIGALADFLAAGRIKIFTASSNTAEGFYNKHAHPLHRSWVQRRYDEHIRWEVIPFIQDHVHSHDIGVTTMGASLGAYHAANTLFKHPDVVKRCYALSGVYDMKRFMDGMYDENFYFNNPVDYLPGLSDPYLLRALSTCEIHIATGSGPWEDSSHSYRLSEILRQRGIQHHLDDWGPMGGHDWPYWKHQMREYVSRL